MLYTRTPYKIQAFLYTMLPTSKDLKESVRKRNIAMNWLLTEYPMAFNLGNRQPLKEDILEDILAENPPEMPTPSALKSAYKYYTEWGSYLANLINGANRIDLKGKIAGIVDEATERKAKQHLEQAALKFR